MATINLKEKFSEYFVDTENNTKLDFFLIYLAKKITEIQFDFELNNKMLELLAVLIRYYDTRNVRPVDINDYLDTFNEEKSISTYLYLDDYWFESKKANRDYLTLFVTALGFIILKKSHYDNSYTILNESSQYGNFDILLVSLAH